MISCRKLRSSFAPIVKRGSGSPLAAHVAVFAQHNINFVPVVKGAVSDSIAGDYATLRPVQDGVTRNSKFCGNLGGAGILSAGVIVDIHIP